MAVTTAVIAAVSTAGTAAASAQEHRSAKKVAETQAEEARNRAKKAKEAERVGRVNVGLQKDVVRRAQARQAAPSGASAVAGGLGTSNTGATAGTATVLGQ